MQTPELLTVQKYASKYRLSIHNVIKKTMNGELETLTREENGKEITYIVQNPSTVQPNNETPSHPDTEAVEIDYKKAYEDLHKEYLILKTKYQKMVEMLEG
jgi:hypothetical protein